MINAILELGMLQFLKNFDVKGKKKEAIGLYLVWLVELVKYVNIA